MAAGRAGNREDLPTNLSGGRLLAARVLWLAFVAVTLLIFIASIPVHLADLHETCAGEACVAGQRAPAEVRVLEELGVSLDGYTAYVLALDLVVALGFCAVGAVIFWRRSREPGALFVSFALVIFGLTWPDTFDSALYDPAWGGVARFLTQLGLSCLFVFFFVFPDGRFVPRWSRWVVPLVLVLPVLDLLFPESVLVDPPPTVNILLFLGLWACCTFAQLYRYRRVSGPVGRQQTKWVVFGATASVALLVVFLLPFVFFPALGRPGAASLVSDLAGLTVAGSFGLLLIPVSLGFAVLKYRLYDIDIIINRTLVYGVLSLLLGLIYFGAVVLSQAALRTLTGGESSLAVVASTLAIAALFNPLRRTIQAFIDRRFYRSKYDARKTLEAFSARLRHETDLDALSGELVSVVHDTMHPHHASLWLKPPDGLERSKGGSNGV
jgi:hypothetical protein